MTVTVKLATVGRVVVALVCLALLTSLGGAGIYAAPVTLPLLWLVAWDSGRGWRVVFDVIAVLTAAELGWAVGYAAGGALEWVLPLVFAAVVAVGYPLTQRAASPPRRAEPAA